MPLSEPERAAVELGRVVVDEALVGVGEPAALSNPAVSEFLGAGGLLPGLRLEKPGCLPITIQLGVELELAIGPFSEFLVHELSVSNSTMVRQDLERVLRAEVQVSRGRLLSWTLQLVLEGAPLWGPATYLGGRRGGVDLVPGRYPAFAAGAR